MFDETLILRVSKLTSEQLDSELASHEHNDMGRHIILQEKMRRSVVEAARPHWTVRCAFFVALIAAIFAGISALPEIRSWLRETSIEQSAHTTARGGTPQSITASVPDFGSRPTDACKQAIQDHFQRAFGAPLAFQFGEATQASVENSDKPGQKVHGWLFEARWNFKPPSKSNFPMAAQFLARSDSVILTSPIGGSFESWEAKVWRDEGKKQ